MGILCTRTILSILPTLSREYDQHFKSFEGIPSDITMIRKNLQQAIASASGLGIGVNSGNNNNSNNNSGSGSNLNSPGIGNSNKNGFQSPPLSRAANSLTGANKATGKNRSNSVNSTGKESSDENEDENEVESDTNTINGNNNSNNNNTAADEKEEAKMPDTRGSRCFEVLGFDIMIDNNLKPWLIEVNHLPRFVFSGF